MRGKLLNRNHGSEELRITPARAGKTVPARVIAIGLKDHPRACGENPGIRFPIRWILGSPPRVRGKQAREQSFAVSSGITPARAGKTDEVARLWAQNEDHPRACGENLRPFRYIYSTTGSPPRVRGKPAQRWYEPVRRGITPARAGKTVRPQAAATCSRDHPRACGENVPFSLFGTRNLGSPPRVRGKQFLRLRIKAPARITPARAGKPHQRSGL